MSAVRKLLEPWESELRALPNDLLTVIGPWLGRIRTAMGKLSGRVPDGDAEPDGVAALSRHGDYERLLMSEWLLADEAPDEFLRRAVDREHLFTAIERKSPVAARAALVLFDSGPTQLGAPRLAHLAILLAASRRARESGARLFWGVLQKPTQGVFEFTGAGDIVRLIQQRTATSPSVGDLETWRAHRGDDYDEAWVVASTDNAPLASGFRLLCVDEPLDLERRFLRLSIGASSSTPLELDLPREETSVRALREETRAPSTPSASRVPERACIMLPGDGRRLAAVDGTRYLSWGLPNSSNAPLGKPRAISIDGNRRFAACGHRGRRAVAVVSQPGGFEVIGLTDASKTRRAQFVAAPELAEASRFVEGEPIPDAICAVLSSAASSFSVAFLNRRGELVGIVAAAGKTEARVYARSVVAAQKHHQGVMVVQSHHDEGPGHTTIRIVRDGVVDHHVFTDSEGQAGHVFFGSCDRAPIIAYDVAAQPNVYRLRSLQRESAMLHLHAPSEETVIGCHHDNKVGRGLITVSADGRKVYFIGPAGSHCIATASGTIEHAVVSGAGGLVAWRSSSGWVEVASIPRAAVVAKIEVRG